MNDLTPAPQDRRDVATQGGNIGAIAIESERAIAEIQGQLIMARRFPRSMTDAMLDFLDACKSPEFAATAFYAVPNRGNGPSIRFAEECARCYGNFDYGHRELSRIEPTMTSPGRSEIEVYAWDKEKNNYSKRQITVVHVTDTKQGPKRLTDQTDIDNKIANVASKQMRGRILALLPKAIVAAGAAEAKKTLAGGNERPLSERIIGLCKGFANYGISTERLEKYLGHKVDDITLDEFADLVGIGAALKEGGVPSEYFPSDSGAEDTSSGAPKAIADAAKRTAATPAAKPRAASKPVEAASKPVKDAAAPVTEKAAPAETAKEAESAPEPDQIAEANSAASAAAEDDDGEVF